jgi:hypothetical protein
MSIFKTYRKTATVRALQPDHPGVIHTLEGDMKYEAGDYIVYGDHDDCWPVRRDIFEATYEETA